MATVTLSLNCVSIALVQRSANSSPQVKSGPLPVFVNKVLLEHNPF